LVFAGRTNGDFAANQRWQDDGENPKDLWRKSHISLKPYCTIVAFRPQD
jgi:hypothetical protein